MHRTITALIVMAMSSACTTVSSATANLEDRTLSYGCRDIVVIGRVKNENAYDGSHSADDLIGHGWFGATLHVRKAVSGASVPATLPVKYLAHTFMREDRDFMFVLTPVNAGFEIATAQLMSARPRAVRDCPYRPQ